MQRTIFTQTRFFSIPDLIILLLLGTTIYALVVAGRAWQADFNPVTQIDLSVWALPHYTLLSAMRGITGYLLSLLFTLVVGYAAAKNQTAEKIIIPMLDILQSIPVLGFLPGLVLGLIAIFPHSNIGLELAAVLLIFTGQVWNMTFSFYGSLKSIPSDFNEASTVIGLSRWKRLIRLELPFSAVNLAWNSLMSMAGGWFFLSVCEAFTLGDREYRLPGLGAYMSVASAEGNQRAMVMGVIAMVLLIVFMDFAIWRPILAWVRRFRLEEVPGVAPPEPLMNIFIRESRIIRWLKLWFRQYRFRHRLDGPLVDVLPIRLSDPVMKERLRSGGFFGRVLLRLIRFSERERSPGESRLVGRLVQGVLGTAALGVLGYGSWRLFGVLFRLDQVTWFILIRNTLWTFLRVLISIGISTLWAVPVGIWIGVSPRRTRIAQPFIQVLASFPAPMLYPIALAVFFAIGISFDWGSMFLMLLGVQWYVLFNVLAGALRIPRELGDALDLMEASRWTKWKTLYIPSVFPSLVTGWVTAAGGAWNASIVAEVVKYKGVSLTTGGLGSTISAAAEREDFPLLAAGLFVMVVVVIFFNRAVWARIYHLAQTRFRMDM